MKRLALRCWIWCLWLRYEMRRHEFYRIVDKLSADRRALYRAQGRLATLGRHRASVYQLDRRA